MKRQCLLLFSIAFGLAAPACKGYQNVGADGYKTPVNIYASADGLPDLTCEEGLVLQPTGGAKVSWEVTRFKLDSGKELPFLGSNLVYGQLNVPGNDLSKASAVFNFDIKSTFSDDPLRDERIHEYIFGLHEGHILRFTFHGIKETGIILEKNNAVSATVLGVLEVGGKSTEVEVPVLIKSLGDSYVIATSDRYSLNLRAFTQQVNGVDIGEQIKHMLSFVTNLDIRDEVLIDFNLEMKNTCVKPKS